MEFMKGPDFPTGAIVEGIDGIKTAFQKGKGKVVVRSKTEIIHETRVLWTLIRKIWKNDNKVFTVVILNNFLI